MLRLPPTETLDAEHPGARHALQGPRGAGHARSAAEVGDQVHGCGGGAEGADDGGHDQEMEGAVEERKCGTLARAVERGTLRQAVAPLHVGRRQGPQRASHLGRAQVRQVTRFQGAKPRGGGVEGRGGLRLDHEQQRQQ